MYTCRVFDKRITLDDYEQGEAERSDWCSVNLDFENETLQGLLEDIAKFFEVSSDALEAEHGNDGFIAISRHEDADGEIPTNQQITSFLYGKCKLWSVIYTGVIHKTTEVSAVELNEALNNIE